MYERYIKRCLDVIFAVIALPIVLVVCIIFGALIWLEDRGTIFYLAKRRGKDGTIFNMYKLRSMKVNAPDIRNKDNSTFNSADDPRVTKIGKLMRKISVDELPQVFNILKGDMSWIGPRPVTTDRPFSRNFRTSSSGSPENLLISSGENLGSSSMRCAVSKACS